jgi:hypothetical protein
MKDTPMSQIRTLLKTPTLKTAPVDKFVRLRPRVLLGQRLVETKAVQASILRFGLLSPIVVTRQDDKLIVVDGRKRLAALRRLAFLGRLPRSLVNVPYVELSDVRLSPGSTPALMSNRELFETVARAFHESRDVEAVAHDLYLTHKDVRQILTLSRLSPRLRAAYFARTIDFHRAHAYAALPDIQAQDAAFAALGPFATAEEIIAHIRTSERETETIRTFALVA